VVFFFLFPLCSFILVIINDDFFWTYLFHFIPRFLYNFLKKKKMHKINFFCSITLLLFLFFLYIRTTKKCKYQ
jgi:hypothetical protein